MGEFHVTRLRSSPKLSAARLSWFWALGGEEEIPTEDVGVGGSHSLRVCPLYWWSEPSSLALCCLRVWQPEICKPPWERESDHSRLGSHRQALRGRFVSSPEARRWPVTASLTALRDSFPPQVRTSCWGGAKSTLGRGGGRRQPSTASHLRSPPRSQEGTCDLLVPRTTQAASILFP